MSSFIDCRIVIESTIMQPCLVNDEMLGVRLLKCNALVGTGKSTINSSINGGYVGYYNSNIKFVTEALIHVLSTLMSFQRLPLKLCFKQIKLSGSALLQLLLCFNKCCVICCVSLCYNRC